MTVTRFPRFLGCVIALLAILAGCARPPHLDTSLTIQKAPDGVILVKLKIANAENTPTTPIAIQVTGQSRSAGHWDKPTPLLTPAAFVLNRKEQREITKFWRIQADAARATLVIKEQETGHLIKTEKTEKVF